MQLSKSFSLEEMIFSETAERLQLDNYPGAAEIDNMKKLCENVLQPVRDMLGKPVIINSGFRSAKVSVAVGSSAKSQHCKGQAADIRVVGMSALQVCKLIVASGIVFDQLIYEGTWVHVSFNSDGNKKQILTAHFHRGGPVTYTIGLPNE